LQIKEIKKLLPLLGTIDGKDMNKIIGMVTIIRKKNDEIDKKKLPSNKLNNDFRFDGIDAAHNACPFLSILMLNSYKENAVETLSNNIDLLTNSYNIFWKDYQGRTMLDVAISRASKTTGKTQECFINIACGLVVKMQEEIASRKGNLPNTIVETIEKFKEKGILLINNEDKKENKKEDKKPSKTKKLTDKEFQKELQVITKIVIKIPDLRKSDFKNKEQNKEDIKEKKKTEQAIPPSVSPSPEDNNQTPLAKPKPSTKNI
jgi:hypothetical protein